MKERKKFFSSHFFNEKFLVTISTCHNYEIDYKVGPRKKASKPFVSDFLKQKFRWECEDCATEIGRHSNSFDTEKFRCAKCKGKFIRIQ